MTLRQTMESENIRSPIITTLIDLTGRNTSRLKKNKGGHKYDFESNCISSVNQNNNSDTSLGYYNAYMPKTYNFHA